MGANKESPRKIAGYIDGVGSLSLLNNLTYSYSLHTGFGCIKIKKKVCQKCSSMEAFLSV